MNEGELGNKDGHSLQRIPNGEGGTRNTANYTQLEPTPGAINEVPAEPVTIIINEADADTAGTDTGEFVELYDGGAGNSPLDGLVLVFYNGSNDSSYAAYDLDGFTTNANGYFVLGNVAVPNVSIIIPSNGLQNGADAVALYKGDVTDFPNGTAISTANLIDALVYDTNDGDDASLLVLLNAGQPQLNEGGQGNKDGHSNQRFENGTGGLRNTSSYVQAIPTPGAVNTNALEPIDLIINEIDADTAGSDTEEFVELYDGGKGNTSLDGFVLVNYNGNGDASYNALDLDGYTTNAEGYFVVGNATVANVDVVVPGNYFQNGADAVVLYQGDATDFPNGTTIVLDNIIDAVVYDTNDSDDAGLLVLLNAGEAQLNEGELGNKDGHSLQRIPNGEGGARNTSTYLPDTPTPGTENGAAVVPTDPIPIVDARAAVDGTQVTIAGVLTVADNLGGSAYIQDTTGAIAVFDEAVHGEGVFAVGDSITITGIRSMFNEQLQISPVLLVESNGLPNQPIEPLTITLAELSQHPAELVRIMNPSFPKPGDILFGSANYVLTDTSGTGELRIDNSVESIVGLGQPESCSEVIGVVGRFFETFQLLPRLREDLACAGAYENPANSVTVDKSLTFDIVTWNIEWFGDEQNSPAAGDPMSDAIQKDSVKSVISRLNADIIAVQEIADDALFAQMVNELPGYNFVLSDAVSRPNDPGISQKVGFIYKTETVTNVSTKVLLQSIHPLYNGGDDSALVNYPSSTDRFYASGRLPFMLSADVMIEGETKPFNIVDLHARANGSTDAQLRYDMRKYDVEVLKDSLDVMYPNANIILLGDYNDDVDVTVADVATTVSTYEEYIADTVNYNILTAVLSENGFRSFVSRENMIDHISVSDELIANNIMEAISVHYEFYDADYTRTTSDHLPVSTRLQLNVLSLEPAILTNVSCNGAADGTISIEAKGGIKPYSYQWSDGQTTATASGLSAGIYSLTVTDALGTSLTSEVAITEPTALVLSLVEDQTVYFGYEAASCTTLSVVELFGGNPTYSYEWSTGESTEAIEVCPQETTVYSLTVTDANGCTVTATVMVEVIDVRCGNNPRNPKVEVCFNGQNLCISVNAVPTFLNRGASLGACNEVVQEIVITNLETFPNPFTSSVNVWLRSTVQADVAFVIYDFYGNIVHQSASRVYKGTCEINISGLDSLRTGYYYLKPMVNGRAQATKVLLKN